MFKIGEYVVYKRNACVDKDIKLNKFTVNWTWFK